MDNQKLNIKPKNGYGFIYCYTSTSGKKYIGQTKTSLKERAKKNAKGYKGCAAFYNAILKYGLDSFEVEILEEVPIENLDLVETQYILDFDTTNPQKGYNILTNHQQHMSILNRIPVYAYDAKTGLFVDSYESISAAERAIGVYSGSVQRVVNIKDRTAKGFLWKTEKFDRVEVSNREQKNSVMVYMYDAQTGDFLQSFSSIREAARETGYNRSIIQDHVSRNIIKKGKKHRFTDFKVDNLFNESSTTIL